MKKSRQQLRQQLSRPGVVWASSRWRRRRRRGWSAVRQFGKKTNWQLVSGTCVGVSLVAFICAALLSYTKAPLPLVKKFGDAAEVRQELQETLTSEYNITAEFTKKLNKETRTLREQDLPSIRKLTLRELLKVRNELVEYVRYLNYLRGQRRNSLMQDLNWLKFKYVKNSNYKNLMDEDDRSALLNLQTDSLLAKLELPLLAVVDTSEQELARIKLKYLGQRVQAYPPLSNATWQRDLAQLQLLDSRHAELTQAEFDTLRQAELTLLRATELRRSELLTTPERQAARFLDSCRSELLQLQLLDSCRQELTYWFPGTFGKPYPPFPAEEHVKIPEDYYKQANKAIKNYQSGLDISDISVTEIVIVAFIIMLLVSPFIGGASLLQLRRELRTRAAGPAPEVEPPVLQALLLAYADTIREVLLMPRKIKRFAGKVRLQYYLLATLSREQIRAENQFKFDPTEQVLAFLLLLLIEWRTQRLHAPLKDEAEFRQQLMADYKEALATGRFETAASASRQFSCRQGIVTLRLDQGSGPESEVIVALAKALKSSDAERLLKQLHWLNAGLLV